MFMVSACAISPNRYVYLDYSVRRSSGEADSRLDVSFTPVPLSGGILEMRNKTSAVIEVNMASISAVFEGVKLDVFVKENDPRVEISRTWRSSFNSTVQYVNHRDHPNFFNFMMGYSVLDRSSGHAESSSYSIAKRNPETIFIPPAASFRVWIEDPLEKVSSEFIDGIQSRLFGVHSRFDCAEDHGLFSSIYKDQNAKSCEVMTESILSDYLLFIRNRLEKKPLSVILLFRELNQNNWKMQTMEYFADNITEAVDTFEGGRLMSSSKYSTLDPMRLRMSESQRDVYRNLLKSGKYGPVNQ